MTIDFPAIQTKLTDKEVDLICSAIRHAKTLTMGPYLHEFENNFAEYIGVKYAAGVSNGTIALELAAIISGIKEGEEVILPAHTFASTALPFLRRKAKIVFADIHPETFVMDLFDVRKKVTSRTRVVVPVHLYGLPVEMDSLLDIAEENNLIIIEDCAQSPGAEFKGKKTGSFGNMACFSFHSQKNITALGEGGMITTDNEQCYEKILGLRKIGSRPYVNQEKYWIPAMSNIIEAVKNELPYNAALGEIQAFAGNLLLNRIDNINKKRKDQRNFVVNELSEYEELMFQNVPKERKSAYHLLPAKYDGSRYKRDRDDLIEILFTKYGIKCVVQYLPLYRYELFQKNGYSERTCPNSDDFFDNMISFPFASDMPDDQLYYLIESIKKSLKYLRG